MSLGDTVELPFTVLKTIQKGKCAEFFFLGCEGYCRPSTAGGEGLLHRSRTRLDRVQLGGGVGGHSGVRHEEEQVRKHRGPGEMDVLLILTIYLIYLHYFVFVLFGCILFIYFLHFH